MDEEVTRATIGERLTAAEAMRLAIREGHRGAGFVAPNPLVGCVILDREFRFLASGYHAKLGADHAEAAALRKITNRARFKGAHAFVTLEPCAHQGRTPSCAHSMAPLGFASVTFAVRDPNPVAQNGAAILRAAGVSVFEFSERRDIEAAEREDLIARAEDLAEIFLHNQRAHEPFIAVKIASSLDGQMALKSGESQWITGEAARSHVHLVRARYDAVAVGAGTFFADDPSLNVRHERYPDFENRAVIFDPDGRVVRELARRPANLMRVRAAEKIVLIVSRGTKVSAPAGVRVLEVPLVTGAFAMPELLLALKGGGVTSILIEGGAATIGNFMRAGKVSRLHAYLAPVLLGAANSLAWSAGFGVEALSEKVQLTHSRRRLLGDDLYWTARVQNAREITHIARG